MRAVLFLALTLASGLLWADREITIPKGRRLTAHEWRAEILGVPGEKTSNLWFGTGLFETLDFELSLTRTPTREMVGSFDFSYNFAPPLVDVSPGISFGVQDALNRTESGRALYFATTYRYGNDGEFNQDVPTEVTFGFWTKSSGLFFIGSRLPFSEHVILIAEHNSERLAGGFELRPLKGMVLKTVFASGATSLGLSLTHKF